MNVGTALETNTEATEVMAPGMGTFNDPAILAQAAAMFGTASGDHRLDTTIAQRASMRLGVVTTIGVHHTRSSQWMAAQSANRCNRVDQRQPLRDVADIRASQDRGERRAVGVGDDVSLRSKLAAVGRVGAGFLAPGGLETLAPSRLARSRSIWSCSRSRRSIARCSRCHTPAACQSRRRRQHVMPLPKPSSCGRSSCGMPACSTYRMPLSAARSSTVRRRPPLGDGANSGISGSSSTHNSLLILRLAIPQTMQRLRSHV